jgi:putative transposase
MGRAMSQNSHSKERFDKRHIPDQWRDLANWHNVDTEDWPEYEKSRFHKYESALFEYLSDTKIDDVCAKYDIEKSLFYEVLKRCLQIFPGEDRIYGKRALILYTRIDDYTRKKTLPRYPEKGKEGLAGAFTCLLKDHSDIEKAIKEYAYKKGKGVIHENRIELQKIHKEFLNACRREGIPLDAYPFNTEEKGKRALSKYLKNDLLKKQNLRRGVAIKYGTKAAQKLGSGESEGFLDPLYPLQEGQIDGHRIDAKCVSSPRK